MKPLDCFFMSVAAIEAAGGNGSSLLHVPDKSTASSLGLGGGGTAGGSSSSSSNIGGTTGGNASSTQEAALTSGDGGVPPPPRSLMAFPPVARLVNVVLTSFNQLREVREGGMG